MKIREVRTIVTCPGRNYVTVKIITEDGLYGVGDATLNGRELAVAETLREHLAPDLVGMDAGRIEDVWQHLFRGTYWRGGPVLMTALSGIDMALWDLKGKAAGMPVYQLLGGKARDKARVYRHAAGATAEACLEDAQRIIAEEGCDALRVQIDSRPAHLPGWEPDEYMRDTPKLLDYLRKHGPAGLDYMIDVHGRLTPIQAADLARRLEPYGLFFLEDPVRPEHKESLRLVRAASTLPLAIGELFHHKWECLPLMTEQLTDYVRVDLAHAGGITEAKKIAAIAEAFHIRTAFHGPGDISPITHCANVSVDLTIPNFGIQEYVQFPEQVREVFTGGVGYDKGYLYASEQPGLGVDIDEKEAAKYPYKRDGLPTLRRADGSVQDW